MNRGEVTDLLHRWNGGDREAGDELMRLVYDELRAIAARELRRERPGHTLQPTALAHEAYLKMVAAGGLEASDRGHFLAVVARVIRRILVDYARERGRLKRGGDRIHVQLIEALVEGSVDRAPDFADLDHALDQLADVDPVAAKVVEMKFYGGMQLKEIAGTLDVSRATVSRKWTYARAWLHAALESAE